MTHQTYAAYVAGCRCALCTRANAAYKARYRKKKLAGKIILGAIRSAKEAKAMLDALHREHFTQARVGHELGLHFPQRQVQNRITVRKHLRIQRVYQRFMQGGEQAAK